ncbi:hypothetical protein N7481_004879 [Penicillium waksmanii]|uniref:uncharacterized protein n=1 Tax=Penicillium waksmanii TaxID=69791 RepID=UPI0025493E53|nr:uncharacterized protein N7481_004879 [Penicillium waksmanii]KAJ5989669.1 hypothetical protein N7481_004879 [Penicillium waksmanii]
MPTVVASDVQYFAMGIYFPFGIALFQASNLRFLYVAKAQRQFANADFYNARKCNKEKSSILGRWKSMKYMNKVLLLITTGMVFQLVVTIGMWLACAKYHPTYGISGTEVHGTTLAEQRTSMDQGWEWWPSVLWQVVWTWVAAPILFMRAWGVRDTMGWRTQTIACCVASFPGFEAAGDEQKNSKLDGQVRSNFFLNDRKVNPFIALIRMGVFLFIHNCRKPSVGSVFQGTTW